MRVKIDKSDPDNPSRVSGRIYFDEPPLHLLGKTAAELRAIGLDIPEEIPGCSKAKQAPDGGWQFDWVTVEFVL